MMNRSFTQPFASTSRMFLVAGVFITLLALGGCDGRGNGGATQSANNQTVAETEEIDTSVDPSASEETKIPSVYLATVARDVDQVRASIAAGADVNELYTTPTGGYSAAHIAARNGLTEILQLLIDAGADLDIRADAPHHATPLHWAVRWRQFDAVVMLIEAGADPNIHAGLEDDITPLGLAVQGNMPDIVQYLTSKGAQM